MVRQDTVVPEDDGVDGVARPGLTQFELGDDFDI